MRIKELIEITGVSRQTIHFYTREGLLQRPKKTSPNQAEYSEAHVERIKIIRQLHEQLCFPLETIKKVLEEQENSAGNSSVLKTKIEFLRPLDQLLAQDVHSETTFLELTGISPERLEDFEKWEIITPKLVGDQKVYSHHDLTIGRVIGEMRRLGISYERGFRRDAIKEIRDMLHDIAAKVGKDFAYGTKDKVPPEQIHELSEIYTEIVAVFFYHLSHRLVKEEVERNLGIIRSEQGDQ
ncbi:MerR family transcriptional regulator [Desulforhopalus singaporensis]|uniref:MerR HTH family regulatory protein n=1 Tax=Desulforhopalus singaporensis TaxID=91360 RepID=A0A1H0KLH1_9BACT|nr:MerR family transcriptional regulator [Desulforhopalus singaporensis]SDO56834.1 MerR HTH family regulatory protein [Desulforhopalus singaporensis]